MYEYLPTPAIVAELDQITENLKKMQDMTKSFGIHVRPHIKPHKSVYFAKEQLALGAKGITCARLHEAEVMAQHGITDILLAYPLIGTDKMDRLKKLMEYADIITIVNSLYGARQLSQTGMECNKVIPVLIEVDGGLHRGGVPPYDAALSFAEKIRSLPGISIKGLMYYNGLIYSETSMDGYIAGTRKEHDELTGTASLLKQHGFSMDILSGGNSYSSKCCQYLKGITEVRCGNYIFNDVSALATGFATEDECALRAVATVVSKVDDYHASIDAGSKTLTTDLTAHRKGYGYVIGRPDILISKLNEEHGFIESEHPLKLNIGDKIAIIPNHSCVLPNLTDQIYGIRNDRLERMIPVDARGDCH